ncbi:MFS transporter [Pseudomonas sp. 148P]|uniref:MFS transporter n=1 Tax=Pseudomonas ulcerans TaxID=3115852 RepID=A0ABU7HKS6_9PSED|nr:MULTISPECIES: MFS transporter [unclassified Pseudomonas]MEE1920979.1 MFS transporter [Pseudomonas sp. 147P]MEE1932120.1 MFS transporter [Pseudomonas sp. 148P]
MNTPLGSFRRHYTLFLLFVVSAVNLVDRQIMGVVIEPIKQEFHATDTQMGLLTGLAFAVVYCVCSLGMGRYADRNNRRNLIAGCCAVWSVMTAMCGMATGFWTLALARLGVAVGESGSSAASMSVIADLYRPAQRPKAISVFMLAPPVGTLLGLSVGAWITYYYGWREAFLWMAIPGLVAAVLLRLSGSEPQRGHWEAFHGGVESGQGESIWKVIGNACRSKPYISIVLAGALLAFAGYAFGIWSSAFLVRSHGLSIKDAGAVMGLAAGPGAIIGSLSSGWLTAHLARRDVRWQLGIPVIGALLAMPLAIASVLLPATDPWTLGSLVVPRAAPFIFGMSVFGMWWMAPTYTAVAQMVAPGRRATLLAFYNFGIMALGAGLGPLVTGMISDALTPTLGSDALRWALVVSAGAYVLAAIVLVQALGSYARGSQPVMEPVVSGDGRKASCA